jgi:broad specificity phosphatase PhoE
MSHIILVRHGQASFLERDYDRLCANGEAQAGLLGKYWSRRGVVFGGAYSGPRVRQLETARIVAEAYRSASLGFPETVVMSEFDEYQAEAVLRECLPQLLLVNARSRNCTARMKIPANSVTGARRFRSCLRR